MMGLPSYPECPMKRETPKLELNKEVIDSLGKDYRVLPIFEKEIFDYKYRRYYSLYANKLLQCRWRSYVQNFSEREMAPFQFIDIRDYHFFNCINRLIPKETIHKKTDFRYKLKTGPGVDFGGQMPIPQDLLMKRDSNKITQPRHSKANETKEKLKIKKGAAQVKK